MIKEKRKKIAVICTGFYAGGFTTSLLAMLKRLKEENVDVDLYLYGEKHTEDDVYPEISGKIFHIPHKKDLKHYRLGLLLNPSYINYRFFRKNSIAQKQLELISYTKNNLPLMNLKSYDAVVSWEEMQCNYFLIQNVQAMKKIGYMHPDYVQAGFNAKIDLPLYQKLDDVVCVSKATQRTMQDAFPSLANRIKCVFNPLDTDRIDALSQEKVQPFRNEDAFHLLTVCRLDIRSKALDRAVRIAAELEKKGLSFEWHIIGDGEDRAAVETMIQEYHVKHLHLIGEKKNPYPYYKMADLFVLQSYYEGKPVTVDEAQYLNLPVLVTDYSSAKEQVKEECGFIVTNDENAITSRLEQIITNPSFVAKKKQNLEAENHHAYGDISSFLKLI